MDRYSRQVLFKEFGEKGQRRLRESTVLVVGVGGLGSVVSLYLVYAGIGRLKIVDCDVVEMSNLNRQILYTPSDIGKEKVFVAAEKLSAANKDVEVIPYKLTVGVDDPGDLFEGVDVVLDGLDNMEARLFVNKECWNRGIPYIYGGVEGMTGMVTTIVPGETPCLECVVKGSKRSEGPIPVFGPTPGMVASIETLEAIKLVSGIGTLLKGKMLILNGESWDVFLVELFKKKNCKVCGGNYETKG